MKTILVAIATLMSCSLMAAESLQVTDIIHFANFKGGGFTEGFTSNLECAHLNRDNSIRANPFNELYSTQAERQFIIQKKFACATRAIQIAKKAIADYSGDADPFIVEHATLLITGTPQMRMGMGMGMKMGMKMGMMKMKGMKKENGGAAYLLNLAKASYALELNKLADLEMSFKKQDHMHMLRRSLLKRRFNPYDKHPLFRLPTSALGKAYGALVMVYGYEGADTIYANEPDLLAMLKTGIVEGEKPPKAFRNYPKYKRYTKEERKTIGKSQGQLGKKGASPDSELLRQNSYFFAEQPTATQKAILNRYVDFIKFYNEDLLQAASNGNLTEATGRQLKDLHDSHLDTILSDARASGVPPLNPFTWTVQTDLTFEELCVSAQRSVNAVTQFVAASLAPHSNPDYMAMAGEYGISQAWGTVKDAWLGGLGLSKIMDARTGEETFDHLVTLYNIETITEAAVTGANGSSCSLEPNSFCSNGTNAYGTCQ